MTLAATPVRIDPALLKATLPELVLRPGMSLVARVASRGEGQAAALVLGQALIAAKVPDEVAAGATLKLRVEQATPDRVVLKLVEQELPPPEQSQRTQQAGGSQAAQHGHAAQGQQPGQPLLQHPVLAPQEAPFQRRGREQGAHAQVRERPRVEGDRATVAVGFTGAAIGPLEAKLDLGPEGLGVVLRGRAAALLEAAAPDLQRVLLEQLGRPVNITVLRDATDVRA